VEIKSYRRKEWLQPASDATVRKTASVCHRAPPISGIGWVSELVEIAGRIDIFADRRDYGAALLPGPAALTNGLAELQNIIKRWASKAAPRRADV
jgi:hypothetical protein